MFIDGCKKYGVSEKDMFVTLDLYEKTNPNMVNTVCLKLFRLFSIRISGDFWTSSFR